MGRLNFISSVTPAMQRRVRQRRREAKNRAWLKLDLRASALDLGQTIWFILLNN
jgi:hypothetical protein